MIKTFSSVREGSLCVFLLLSLLAVPPYMMRHTGWRGIKRANSLTQLLIKKAILLKHIQFINTSKS